MITFYSKSFDLVEVRSKAHINGATIVRNVPFGVVVHFICDNTNVLAESLSSLIIIEFKGFGQVIEILSSFPASSAAPRDDVLN